MTSTPTKPVDNVVIATKGLQDRNTNITAGTTVENKGKLILAGIPKTFRTYTYGNDRSRAAIIISNKYIDVTTITQISHKDCIAIDIKYNGKQFYAASLYFDSNEDIEGDLQKM